MSMEHNMSDKVVDVYIDCSIINIIDKASNVVVSHQLGDNDKTQKRDMFYKTRINNIKRRITM